MRCLRNSLTPASGEDRCLTKEKAAWASQSVCLKWWVELKAGVSQSLSQLKTREEWKSQAMSLMAVIVREDCGLRVRQCMSSVGDRERHTLVPAPLGYI